MLKNFEKMSFSHDTTIIPKIIEYQVINKQHEELMQINEKLISSFNTKCHKIIATIKELEKENNIIKNNLNKNRKEWIQFTDSDKDDDEVSVSSDEDVSLEHPKKNNQSKNTKKNNQSKEPKKNFQSKEPKKNFVICPFCQKEIFKSRIATHLKQKNEHLEKFYWEAKNLKETNSLPRNVTLKDYMLEKYYKKK